MSKRLWLIIFLSLFSWAVFAQSTRVRGQVRDAETGEPLPFVGVYFDGTTIGISTDMEGRYSLETRSPDAKVLTAQLLGYESTSAPVTKGAFTELDFLLKPDVNYLDAALVRPDDRYIKSILRKLDASLDRNDPEKAPDWHSMLYSKIEMDVTNAEDLLKLGFLDRNIGFVRQYADTSAITGKAYIPAMISETLSEIYHSQNPEFRREIMRANRISGVRADNFMRQFTGSYLLNTNFFKRSIGVFNLDIPNPAAASANIFYDYFLVDSLQVEDRKTYVLRFHPKKLVTSPTLDGEMHIDAEDFGIQSVHAQLSTASNVNWIRHINMDIENRRLPDGRWFFGDERLFIDFSISVSDSSKILSFLGNRQISYMEPVFEPLNNPEVLDSSNPVVMRDVTQGDQQFWETVRPYPLTEREQGIYKMVDDIQQRPFYKVTYFLSKAIFQGYAEIKPLRFEIGPLHRTLIFNATEGVRVQLGGRTRRELTERIRIGGYGAYGFRDREWKWNGSIELMLGRESTRKLTLTAFKDFMQLGSGSGAFSQQNIFSPIVSRSRADKQTMMRSFKAHYDHEFCPNVNGFLEWETYRIWSNPTVEFRLPGWTEENPLLLDSFSANIARAQLRFSWQERVNRGPFDKQYIFTKYPVIYLTGTKGFGGITQNDYPFWMVDGALIWNSPSNALGFGLLTVEGGWIWGSVPYPMLKLHPGNQTYFLDRSACATMNYYEFASDRWAAIFYEHNFNGFFLGKIPLIKKLDLREIVSARCVWGTISPDNKQNAPIQLPEGIHTLETPYVEVGVGLSNILRVIRVDCFWRLTHRVEDDPKRNFCVNVGFDVAF